MKFLTCGFFLPVGFDEWGSSFDKGRCQRRDGALAWSRSDREGSSDIFQALADAEQTEVSRIHLAGSISRIESHAPIFDHDLHVMIQPAKPYGRAIRSGMLGDVEEQFPGDLEHDLVVRKKP